MLEIAKHAAQEAGKILLNYYKKEMKVQQKGKDDLVTNVDYEAENLVLSILKEKFPSHGFDSEESGITGDKDSEYVWVVDALDGTINFSRHLSPFGVCIGLLKNKKPYLGVILDPVNKELFYAQLGKGAFLNDRRIHVSNREELSNAIIASDLTTKKELHADFFKVMEKVSNKVLGIRVTHCTSLNLAHLAVGRYDLYLKNKFNFIDCVAGACIISEAGGKLTDFNNHEISENMKNIVASNGLFTSRNYKFNSLMMFSVNELSSFMIVSDERLFFFLFL